MTTVSVRGLSWEASELSEVSFPGVPQEVASIAKNRGIDDLKEFFRPTFAGSMPDPLVLKDMDKAIEALVAAVKAGKKICVYGDYDVDGATSSAILVRFLRHCGCEVTFYIPQRLSEGYGPNVPAMHKLSEDGVDLVIFADSGTMAFEPLAKAAELGMEIVTLDHHTALDEHPEGILVNPNRKDETGEYYYLCTAGLAFLFVVGLQRSLRDDGFFEDREEYDLKKLMGLAALGTVADVVDLEGLNRAYVKLGLRHMALNPGLAALAEVCEVEPADFSTHTCGFVFGPCINAGGRIDDTNWGTLLLTCDDPAEAQRMASRLYEINRERKEIQTAMESSAHEQAEAMKDQNCIIIYGEGWHPGVVGIVASRIKDAFDRPAIVIGEGGKGSARSIDGFDIGAAIISARQAGILQAGGGHPMAGGLTIDPDRLDEFRKFMDEAAAGVDRPALKADMETMCGSIGRRLVESFKLLAPFGKGNSEPRVVISGGVLTSARKLKDKHVKGTLSGEDGDVDIIMFNCVDTPIGNALLSSIGNPVDVYGRLSINEYMGKVTVQMKPEDIRQANQLAMEP